MDEPAQPGKALLETPDPPSNELTSPNLLQNGQARTYSDTDNLVVLASITKRQPVNGPAQQDMTASKAAASPLPASPHPEHASSVPSANHSTPTRANTVTMKDESSISDVPKAGSRPFRSTVSGKRTSSYAPETSSGPLQKKAKLSGLHRSSQTSSVKLARGMKARDEQIETLRKENLEKDARIAVLEKENENMRYEKVKAEQSAAELEKEEQTMRKGLEEEIEKIKACLESAEAQNARCDFCDSRNCVIALYRAWEVTQDLDLVELRQALDDWGKNQPDLWDKLTRGHQLIEDLESNMDDEQLTTKAGSERKGSSEICTMCNSDQFDIVVYQVVQVCHRLEETEYPNTGLDKGLRALKTAFPDLENHYNRGGRLVRERGFEGDLIDEENPEEHPEDSEEDASNDSEKNRTACYDKRQAWKVPKFEAMYILIFRASQICKAMADCGEKLPEFGDALKDYAKECDNMVQKGQSVFGYGERLNMGRQILLDRHELWKDHDPEHVHPEYSGDKDLSLTTPEFPERLRALRRSLHEKSQEVADLKENLKRSETTRKSNQTRLQNRLQNSMEDMKRKLDSSERARERVGKKFDEAVEIAKNYKTSLESSQSLGKTIHQVGEVCKENQSGAHPDIEALRSGLADLIRARAVVFFLADEVCNSHKDAKVSSIGNLRKSLNLIGSAYRKEIASGLRATSLQAIIETGRKTVEQRNMAENESKNPVAAVKVEIGHVDQSKSEGASPIAPADETRGEPQNPALPPGPRQSILMAVKERTLMRWGR